MVHISHLQFADDTLHFCKDEEVMLELLFDSIKAFEWLSGMKVNWKKSSLSGVNMEVLRARQVAGKFNCKAVHLSVLYLGSPLGGNPKSDEFWSPIQENF